MQFFTITIRKNLNIPKYTKKLIIVIFFLEYAYLASDSNYCRIADEPDPWCYTTDTATRWDWCSIPYCCELNAKNKTKPNIIITYKLL